MYIFILINDINSLWPRAGIGRQLDLKSSGIYSRGGSSPPEATTQLFSENFF